MIISAEEFQLPPIKRRIFDAVAKSPGISAERLREIVWADDPNGGPEDRKCLHVHVHQLNKLLLPFGLMVRAPFGFSGHGVHLYWTLKEEEDASPGEGQRRIEETLKLIANYIGGDPHVAEAARLMRLPGSHNTRKSGESLPVTFQDVDLSRRYDLTELTDFLREAHPIMSAPATAEKKEGSGDGSEGGMSVDEALEAMRFGGRPCIHHTQLRATCKLVSDGKLVTDVVADVLAATRKAVGAEVERNWDWDDEERAVEQMCLDWINKEMKAGRDLSHTLADEQYDKWRAILDRSELPVVFRNRWGLAVRAAHKGNGSNGANHAAESEAGASSGQAPSPEATRIKLQPFRRFDEKALPRREWVLAGHYLLGTLTGTVAPGGAGKSNLSLVESISIALGRDLIYERQIKRYRTWYHNAEDPIVEINRRVAAICRYYKIDMAELEGWLFLTSGLDLPIKIATGNGELKIDKKTVREVVEVIESNEIEVATFDPLIAMHTTGESDNVKMRQVCDEFAKVANVTKCGIEVVHHVRKKQPGQEEHTTADSRGASAVIDAVRSARVLNPMSKTEAGNMEIDELDRLNYVRLDRGKANMSRIGLICWLKFETVTLANGDEGEPGDDVGVVTRWDPPDLRIELTDADRKHFQAVVTTNPNWRADNRAKEWIGHVLAHRFGLDVDSPSAHRRIMATWRQLVQESVLAVEERLDEHRKPRDYVVPGRPR